MSQGLLGARAHEKRLLKAHRKPLGPGAEIKCEGLAPPEDHAPVSHRLRGVLQTECVNDSGVVQPLNVKPLNPSLKLAILTIPSEISVIPDAAFFQKSKAVVFSFDLYL